MIVSAVAVALANESTSKSFFRMLIEKNGEWAGKGWEGSGKGNERERLEKFTVGHARGVKSVTEKFVPVFVFRARLSERPGCLSDGMGKHGGENEPSRGRQIASSGGFTIFRCCVSYEALYCHLVKHVGPECVRLPFTGGTSVSWLVK